MASCRWSGSWRTWCKLRSSSMMGISIQRGLCTQRTRTQCRPTFRGHRVKWQRVNRLRSASLRLVLALPASKCTRIPRTYTRSPMSLTGCLPRVSVTLAALRPSWALRTPRPPCIPTVLKVPGPVGPSHKAQEPMAIPTMSPAGDTNPSSRLPTPMTTDLLQWILPRTRPSPYTPSCCICRPEEPLTTTRAKQ